MNQLQCNACPICLNETTTVTITGCGHQACQDCIRLYLECKIAQRVVMVIRCPLCNHEMTYDEIVMHLTDEYISKYFHYRIHAYAEQDPTLRHCPREDCDEYISLTTEQCKCGQLVCSNCGNKSHNGNSCEIVLDSIYDMDNRINLITRCPKCKVVVQKESGCNHMTCQRCSYQYCWICKRTYRPNHYSKYNYLGGCPNKQFSKELAWKYPKFRLIFPYVLLILFSPIILMIILVLLFVHQFGGAYYIFNKHNNNTINQANIEQRVLIYIFIYGLGGLIMYPFVVLYEIIFVVLFLFYCVFKLLKLLRGTL